MDYRHLPLDIFSTFFRTTSWIVFAAFLYTFIINKLSTSSTSLLVPLPVPAPMRFHTHKAYQAQSKLENRPQILMSSCPFRLLDLPTELVLTILSHCAACPSSYASLVRTSSMVQRLTYKSCLPKMPIRLISSEQVQSFDALLRSPKKGVKVSQSVKHLWLTPLHSKDLLLSINILRTCRQLESLATSVYVVKEGIALASEKPTHSHCIDLTLLSTNSANWTILLDSMSGVTFMSKLRRLRLIGDRVSIPKNLFLDNLTHFSYGTTQSDAMHGYTPSSHAGEEMLRDKHLYPLLKTLVITKPRSTGGLRISLLSCGEQKILSGEQQNKAGRLWLVELPSNRTELEIWCDNALGRGLWQLCSEPYSY